MTTSVFCSPELAILIAQMRSRISADKPRRITSQIWELIQAKLNQEGTAKLSFFSSYCQDKGESLTNFLKIFSKKVLMRCELMAK
jgi:ferritin